MLGFVLLVINLTYVDGFCRRIAWLMSLISFLFSWPCYVHAEHMIVRFANDLFTVLINISMHANSVQNLPWDSNSSYVRPCHTK